MRRVVFLVLALLAPLGSACSLNPPRIVSITPGRDATDVPTNQDIRIAFDRPMNHASVESRFAIEPKVGGCANGQTCRFSWSGDTVTYTHPGANYDVSTTYTVFLRAGYADTSGQSNSLDHSWRFTTEGRPTLVSVDPSDNAGSVARDKNIVLSFNRPMRLDSLKTSIQISPDTAFLVRQRPGGDGSQVEITPLSLLAPNQAYTVSIDGPVDTHGNAGFGRVQTRFKTGTLAITRRIGYLVGQAGQPASGIGVVDPHADPFLSRPTPKLLFQLSKADQTTYALLSFDWSPDGRQIAVVQAARSDADGPIRIIDVASGQAVLTSISGSDVFWSPDGTIVYVNHGVLRRYNPGTFADAALTDPADGTVIGNVAFAPDGKSLAYAAADAQAVTHLWILNLDLRTRFRPIGLDDPADHPAWSSDGTKLAFRRVTSGGPQLWVYDLSASGSAAYRRAAPLDISGAAWLNDNSTLFAATGYGSAGNLFRINIFSATEAGGVVKVTGVTAAPDGSAPSTPTYDRRVAFVGVVDNLPQIFVMNGDGSHPQALTLWEADYPYTGLAPNWTPAG